MMIVGLGMDLVEMERMERIFKKFGDSFIRKILREDERSYLAAITTGRAAEFKNIEYLASRFAAKEAAVKALGTGFTDGINMHDICILPDNKGKPELFFHGRAKEILTALGGTHCLLTITHTKRSAGAVVIIEKRTR